MMPMALKRTSEDSCDSSLRGDESPTKRQRSDPDDDDDLSANAIMRALSEASGGESGGARTRRGAGLGRRCTTETWSIFSPTGSPFIVATAWVASLGDS